jgi:hypothetical protein
MTLVALFIDLGVAISDLLVTVEGSGQWPYIPSIGDADSNVLELPFRPSRLVRKVARLTIGGQTTSFMIAGSISHVQAYLETAQKLALGQSRPETTRVPLNRNSIGSVLDHAARSAINRGQTDVSVIGLRRNTTVALAPLQRKFPYFGQVMLAGSGALEMELFLEARAQNYEGAFSTDSELMKGFRVMHYLPMQLLNSDRRQQSPTLSLGVGGFYEVLLNRGQLEPDDMGWLRILADLEPFGTGVRVRAVWWHSYEKTNLIVMSAPKEDLEITAGDSALLPVARFRVDIFGSYIAPPAKLPPRANGLLPRVPRSRFNSFSLTLVNDPRLLISGMAARDTGLFRVQWSREGLTITLDAGEFTKIVAEAERGKHNPL